jgi:hypothetical protein
MAKYFSVNYTNITVNVVTMVSVIIVAIGFFKPIVFNRIQSKELRRGALALTNVGACFLAALGYFLRMGWNFKYYFVAACALTLASIFTYYCYETIPGVRKFMGGLGYTVISKVFHVGILVASAENIEAAKREIDKGNQEIKMYVTNELSKLPQKRKTDKDLRGL